MALLLAGEMGASQAMLAGRSFGLFYSLSTVFLTRSPELALALLGPTCAVSSPKSLPAMAQEGMEILNQAWA